ncbi:MAG: type II toxin-antitoxin system HicB family antitoxin [Chloroflexota bacterium]
MKLPVILTPGEDGYIVAECPTLPGCMSQGHTEEEALNNIHEAMVGWLEAGAVKIERGAKEPVRLVEV